MRNAEEIKKKNTRERKCKKKEEQRGEKAYRK